MKQILRGFIILVGAGLGIGLISLVFYLLPVFDVDPTRLYPLVYLLIFIVGGILSAVIFFFISKTIIRGLEKLKAWIDHKLENVPTTDIVIGSLALIVSLLIAYLISSLFRSITFVPLTVFLNIIIYVFCAYLGLTISLKRKTDLPHFFRRGERKEKESKTSKNATVKILDTSVIIDGRIFDICQTDIVEGTIVIPGFVLQELRHIADSGDALKRNRGRRGLDVLGRIQKELDMKVIVTDKDYDDLNEVDEKLLRLAKDMKGKVVTNDYNLNKVAAVQNVPVLNINELANALKPVVLPGEEMNVTIVKQGKEAGQGVAYLDDGTMIVVEGAKSLLGDTLCVVVTSVLQTSAGKMIFAKMKNGEKAM